MTKQLFKKIVDPSILYELFEQICLKTDKYYLVDHNAYKKFMYSGLDKPFIETLLEHYHDSKKFYVTRELSYNSFINLIRQICKANEMMFTSNIRYLASRYSIEYLVYF